MSRQRPLLSAIWEEESLLLLLQDKVDLVLKEKGGIKFLISGVISVGLDA